MRPEKKLRHHKQTYRRETNSSDSPTRALPDGLRWTSINPMNSQMIQRTTRSFVRPRKEPWLKSRQRTLLNSDLRGLTVQDLNLQKLRVFIPTLFLANLLFLIYIGFVAQGNLSLTTDALASSNVATGLIRQHAQTCGHWADTPACPNFFTMQEPVFHKLYIYPSQPKLRKMTRWFQRLGLR